VSRPLPLLCEFEINNVTNNMLRCVSNGQQLSAEEIRLSLTSGGVLTRDRKLEISTNCDQILSGGDWKCVLRYSTLLYHLDVLLIVSK